MARKKGTLLPEWLRNNNGKLGLSNYNKLETRDNYDDIQEQHNARIPAIVPQSPIINTVNPANQQRKALNSISLNESMVPLAPVKKNIFQTMFADPSKDPKYTQAKPTLKESSYAKFKSDNPNTPSLLQPLGYVLDTPYRYAPTQRLLTKAGEFLGANMINGKGEKLESKSTNNKILDGAIDIGGIIAGSALTGGSGSNLLTGTDALAQYGGMKIAGKTGSNLLGAYGRGAIDAGASTAIEGLSKGKNLKETAKDTAINSIFGGVMFAGGKTIGDIIPKVGNALTPQGLKNQGINDAFDQTFNKKFGEFKKATIPTEKIVKEVTPSVPIKGKFTVKNTALEKATTEYNNAMETIQNHFMTNKLIPEEIARIKPELGIDINKLASNLENAKTDVRQIGNNIKLRQAAGIDNFDTVGYKPVTKTTTEQIPYVKTLKQASQVEQIPSTVTLRSKSQNVISNPNGNLKPQNVQMKYDTLPLKERDIFNVGDKKVNAYQYDNPTVKPYMKEEAQIMKGEIARGSSPINSGANNVKVPGGSGQATETIGYGNIPSVRSESTQELNKLGTYKQIDKALDDIIHDKGRENYALAKKVELTLDERMTKGYREDMLGYEIPPNAEYLQEKAFIDSLPNQMNTSTIKKSQIPNNRLNTKTTTEPIYSGYESKKLSKPLDTTTKGFKEVKLKTTTQEPYTIKGGQMPKLKPLQKPFTNASKEVASTIEPPTSKLNNLDTNIPKINKNVATEVFEPINTKTSEFKTNTMRNSEFLGDKDTQKMIDNISAQYEVKPNAQTISKAQSELANDFEGVMNRIKSTEKINGTGALNSAEDSAASAMITRQLQQEAKLSGDYTKVKEWLEVLQPKVTETAQSLQALKTWKDLSPEGTIFKAQQVVGEVNRAGVKTYGKNFTPIELTTGEIKNISDGMESVLKMPETTPAEIKAKAREFAKVKKVIGDKVPATLADKIKGLQRISLLLNPKTNVRNVLGNTILGTLENTKDIVSAPLDKLVSLKTGKQTTLFPSFKGLQTQGKGMIKGLKTVVGDAKAGVNTSLSEGQFEIKGDKIFNNKILDKLDKATNTALRFGDEPFYQGAYDESLRQQLKIAKATEPTKDMLKVAKEFAEDRTLQNTSAMSEGFKKLQHGLNKMTSGNENVGIGTFAVPFVKTPANILDKAIDYSPVGSIKAISQLISKKTFNQKQFVDRVGRSVLGTGGIMLGYDLAKNGVITGNSNKDKDVSALDRQMGKSAYSFKSGDTYRTFDWAAPASIMLAIGADMYQEGKTDKDVKSVSVKAMQSGASTLFKQSLLQGFQKLFGYNDLAGGLVNTALNVPTQFVPTALKQASQLKDANLKDTYDPDTFKKLGNQLKAKIPGLSSTLPTKIDTLGREIKQFQGKNNAFNVLVNPAFTTKETGNPTERFVSKLYEETGLKTHFPKVVKDTVTYKADSKLNKSIALTPQEKVDFQKYIGQRTDKEFAEIAKQYEKDNSNVRTQMSATEQVKALGNLLSDIYADGENKILEARGITEWNKKNFGKVIGNNPRQ